MRKFLKSRTWVLRASDGQAMVEYILMILFALSLVALINSTFKRSVLNIWQYYIQQTSAGCPGCSVKPEYRFR